MTEALTFWAVAVTVGALALPLCFRLFGRFPDAGAGFAFSLGLTLVATVYFLLRVTEALPAGRGGFILAVACLGFLMFVLAVRDQRFTSTLRRALPAIAAVVALYSALFFGYAFFRAHTPDIAHTEQPMDFLFLNAVLVSPDYPPHDPWFAGENVSYYYGGYLQAAALTSVSNLWPATGYNLALAAVFASAGTAAAALCAALARWRFGARSRRWSVAAGLGGVLLLLFAGPLASVFELAAAHGADDEGVYTAFGVEGLVRCGAEADPSCPGLPLGPTSRWYPDDHWGWWRMLWMSSWERGGEIDDVYVEVPFTSFLVGALHPHLMAIPGFILALAFCAALWRSRRLLSWREYQRRPWLLPVLAVLFGSLAFTNAWDVLVLTALLGAAVLARNARGRPFHRAIVPAASYLAPPAALALVIYLPWALDLSFLVGGPHAYSGRGTRIEHVLLFWGALLLFALPVIGWARLHPRERPYRRLAAAALLPLLPLAAWGLLVVAGRAAGPGTWGAGDGFSEAFAARGPGGWLTLGGYALSLWLLAATTIDLAARRQPAAMVAALATAGVFLLYGTELLFIRDLLTWTPRNNTVFKFSFQAWLFLALAAPLALADTLRRASRPRRALLVPPIALLLAASLVFTVTASANRTGGFHSRTGLDGLAWVETWHPAEYALVQWLRQHAAPDAVVVEAPGRDFVPHSGAVGSRTGLQNPLGWFWHEVQWRGEQVHPEIERRRTLIDRVYTAPSEADALLALRELSASYVLVGREERERYGDRITLGTFFQPAFAEGDLLLYRVPVVEVLTTR